MSQVKRDQNAVTNVKSVRTEISLLCKQTKYFLHWFATYWEGLGGVFTTLSNMYVGSNGTRTHNHLVRKRTLNPLASLAKWLIVGLHTNWFWVRAPL